MGRDSHVRAAQHYHDTLALTYITATGRATNTTQVQPLLWIPLLLRQTAAPLLTALTRAYAKFTRYLYLQRATLREAKSYSAQLTRNVTQRWLLAAVTKISYCLVDPLKGSDDCTGQNEVFKALVNEQRMRQVLLKDLITDAVTMIVDVPQLTVKSPWH